MRSICVPIIILLALITSAQCQQTAVDWYNKGNVLAGQEKYNESIQAYDQAIKLKPNYDAAWYYKGVALKALGRTNESNAAFAEAKNLTNQFFASVASPSKSFGGITPDYAQGYPGFFPGYWGYYPGYWEYYPGYPRYHPGHYYPYGFVSSWGSSGSYSISFSG
jgi:tetratricopeptide (TPR) repeat protein